MSASPPIYVEACATLGFSELDPPIPGAILDPFKPKYLRPWQVQFLAWARVMEQSELKGFLLADDMGLGKTISA